MESNWVSRRREHLEEFREVNFGSAQQSADTSSQLTLWLCLIGIGLVLHGD